MVGFETIIGQNFPVRLLQTFLRNATLPHALLFAGTAGVGKRTTARIVAMALNCRDRATSPCDPCGRCRSCRQIASDHHPDVLFVEPQGGVLRIDQIRKLLVTLSMKPFSADHRVVIIGDAQAMNAEAANALLKMLEEPPDDTTLILTALQKSDMLPTIVSRCRHIRFNPLKPEELVSLLKASPEIADEFAQTAAILSSGSLTKARRLAMPVWQERRNWLIKSSGLDRRPSAGRRSMTLALAFSAQLAQCKDHLEDLLEILKTWLRDLMIYAVNPALVINADYKHILDLAHPAMEDTQVLAMWQAVEKAQKDIAGKANLRLTLDVMALSLAGYTIDRTDLTVK